MDKTEHIKTISIRISIKYTLLSIIFLGLGIITLYVDSASNLVIINIIGGILGGIDGFIAGVFFVMAINHQYYLYVKALICKSKAKK